MSDTIKLGLWDQGDKNKAGIKKADTILGSFNLNINDIKSGKYSKTNWINLYGAPENNTKEVTKIMNLNPEFASVWKGRVLIRVDHEKTTEKPQCKV